MKKIAYITGSRADFGLMSDILKKISQSKDLELMLYATGMHLMKEFGSTIHDVKRQFPKTMVLTAIFKDDSKEGVIDFYSQLMIELSNAFKKNTPDFVLTLGDRPEMLAVATVCAYLGIPTGQIHAGDKSRSVDEMTRHAITKLSHLFFPATVESAKRIEKMGEEKWRIHQIGAPAIDRILNTKLISRRKILEILKLKKMSQYLLLTWHPINEERNFLVRYTKNIVEAVKPFHLPVVVIYPNSDPGSADIIGIIEKEKNNSQFRLIRNFQQDIFFALEKEASVWIGNSSAGVIESASFGTPVVNLGVRQEGREHAENVIDVPVITKSAIKNSIKKCLFDVNFRQKISKIKNPWGDGKANERIIKVLERIKINDKLKFKQIVY
jgi:GDP/UDP-N,N'-diacetylbacillosamine 2-epimerase (hydrolysing)